MKRLVEWIRGWDVLSHVLFNIYKYGDTAPLYYYRNRKRAWFVPNWKSGKGWRPL